MTREFIKNIIDERLREQVGIEEPTEETETFREDLGLDSLEQIELLMYLEKHFSVNIPDAEAAEVKTVSQMIDAIMINNNKNG